MGFGSVSGRGKVEILHVRGDEPLDGADRQACLHLLARLIARELIRSSGADPGRQGEPGSGAHDFRLPGRLQPPRR